MKKKEGAFQIVAARVLSGFQINSLFVPSNGEPVPIFSHWRQVNFKNFDTNL